MAEFKRKFIINDPNFIKFIEKCYSTTNKIYQFYHFSDSIIIRVSKMESHDGDDNNLLIRIPNQQFKRDIEINITDNEYRSFLKFLNPHKILTRTRHRIYEFGYDIFVDIFEKDYDGLIIAKIEFRTEEQNHKFFPQENWVEITDDIEYNNSNLFKKIQSN